MTHTNDSLVKEIALDHTLVQRDLLAWFAQHARDLPWRRTRDPYHVLVAEMMLQQTQVDRVAPKYHAFLERFPTIQVLADAPTAEVIRAWAGLGYNRRAVNMQRTARALLAHHHSQFPHDVATLRTLPGIGPYTAGAVACFAFEQDVAFMDTNIRRVVQRCFVGPADASEGQLLDIAQALIPAGQGWGWNQAIMELGALVCTSANPACRRCPLQAHCRDYATRKAADEGMFDGARMQLPMPCAARRVAERREAPYAGSRRFYRGRIVNVLRLLPPGGSLALGELGSQLKDGFGVDDMPWLNELAAGLAHDGLIVLDEGSARLP